MERIPSSSSSSPRETSGFVRKKGWRLSLLRYNRSKERPVLPPDLRSPSQMEAKERKKHRRLANLPPKRREKCNAPRRSVTSLQAIRQPGRMILPVSTSKVDRDAGCIQLNHSIGVYPRDYPVILPNQTELGGPGCTSSTFGTGPSRFVVPGQSRVRAIMRSRRFAIAYLRQTYAVALKVEEFRRFRKGTRLTRVPQEIHDPGLSWFVISGSRVNLAFARWCVAHYQRTLGLDPRPPMLVIQYPTLEFLVNYSQEKEDYSGWFYLKGETPISNPRPQPKVGESMLQLDCKVSDSPHGGAGLSSMTSPEESAPLWSELSETVRERLRERNLDDSFGIIALGF